jgi:hypothetical protein
METLEIIFPSNKNQKTTKSVSHFLRKTALVKYFANNDATSLIIISQSFDAMSQSVLIASDIFTVIKVDHFG